MWEITCFLRSATSAEVSFQSSKGMSITTFTPLFTKPWRVEKVSDMPYRQRWNGEVKQEASRPKVKCKCTVPSVCRCQVIAS